MFDTRRDRSAFPPATTAIVGTNRDDVVEGTTFGEDIFGGNGDDLIFGFEGDDGLFGENGDDELVGGPGDDFLVGDNGDDILDGGSGFNTLEGGNGDDFFIAGPDDEIIGGSGEDIAVFAFDSRDVFLEGGGAALSLVLPGGGIASLFEIERVRFDDDEFRIGTLPRERPDERGADIVGTPRGDVIDGTNGDDVIDSFEGDDDIVAFDGDDLVFAGRGDDIVEGGFGFDELRGQSGDDALFGDEGDDILAGGNGRDLLDGGPGFDLLDGGRGIDTAVVDAFAEDVIVFENEDGSFDLELPDGGIDTLLDVEHIEFRDGLRLLDTRDSDAGFVVRLYDAVFDRDPDPGVVFWVEQVGGGLGRVQLAEFFISSDEFRDTFAPDLGNRGFVRTIYTSVLDREPDRGGEAFWTDMLDDGYARERFLIDVSESEENRGRLGDDLDALLFFAGEPDDFVF